MTLLLAVSLLSSTLIGYLAMRVFLPVYKPVWADLTLKICLGAGVGAGVSSCQFFLARLLLGPSRIATVTAELVLVGAAGIAFRYARDTWTVDKPDARPAGWSWLLLAAFLVSLAIGVALFTGGSAANPYGAWDAWSIWNLRARFLAQPDASWRRAFSPALNHIAGGGARHPEYPLLLSGYVARCWTLMGSIGGVTAPIATAALFSLSTVGLVVSTLAILRGWSTAMAGGLILLATTGFLTDGAWQYADVPLAFYYLAAFGTLFLADAGSRRGRTVVVAGLATGLAAWTKDEGLLFALLFGLAFLGYLIVGGDRERWSTLRAFAAGSAAPVAIVVVFRLFIAPPIATPVSVAGAAHQIVEGNRYLQIAKAFWNEGAAMGSGIADPVISLLVLAVCLGIAPGRRRQPVVIASSIALASMFVAYFFAYVITPMDLTWHLSTSLGRLYVQLWPSFVFLLLAALRSADEAPREVPTGKAKKRK
jgi:hypothetical protein